ncbi:5-carboxymethyl-2-hydroxymuconate Delta-isomerase [Streptomyces sp. NPDC052396]|uniref:5-carboxymethyl-2-hydroxymuconate Delta-isomerase n=1 Tax=Streptomyces sp. NPDC052396 TaxID=3365689 RepID=UPI0037D18A1C
MPHITVDYSDAVAGTLDRRAFAQELHPLLAELISTSASSCKTRFRRVEEAVIADGAPGNELIHVEVAILAGRSAELKAQVAAAVVELTHKHAAAADGAVVHVSVEVRDLSPAYDKRVG